MPLSLVISLFYCPIHLFYHYRIETLIPKANYTSYLMVNVYIYAGILHIGFNLFHGKALSYRLHLAPNIK